MYITGFFICGFPYETSEDFQKTINFAKELDLDWALFNLFQPFPGSELYTYCIENNHLNPEMFSRDNLEYYIKTQLSNMILDPKEVEKSMYLTNLEINFVNSRTIRMGNYNQAKRDYEHIVTIAPDHVLGHFCLSKAYTGLGRFQDANIIQKKLKEIVKTNQTQANYLKYFNINLD